MIFTDKQVEYVNEANYNTSNLYKFPEIHKSQLATNYIIDQNPEVSNINEPHELKLGPILGGPKFPNLSIGYHKIKLYNLN